MTPQLLALIAVCVFGVVVFLPLVFVGWDITQSRDFQRRIRLVQYHTYIAYVENCTAQGRPAPLPGAFGKARR